MKIGTMLATTAGALFLAAAPAAAATSAPGQGAGTDQNNVEPAAAQSCRSNHHGSYVCFDPDGDHFYLKDTASDGYSAAVYWETSYGRTGECVNVNGAGSTVDCNYNMRENWTVRFWAVNIDTPTNTYAYWSDERAATM